MRWPRLAAALLLGVLLRGDLVFPGGALILLRDLFFPYLWLFLALDWLIARRHLNDRQVFACGAAFSFLYSGIYTKVMHDGLSPLGVNWGALALEPVEWGIFSVLWFHLLDALFPRAESRVLGAGAASAALIAGLALAAGVYALRMSSGFYYIERFEVRFGFLWDIVFAVAAAGLLKRAWRGDPGAAPRLSRSRLALWAGALRIAAGLFALLGPSLARGFLLNLPSQIIFLYAFFSSSLEV